MSDVHISTRSANDRDPLIFMRRPDLYQWADMNNIEYPVDAPSTIMRQIIRNAGKVPQLSDEHFVFLRDHNGNVKDVSFKRIARSKAPKSKHETRARIQEAKQRDELWEKYIQMPMNDLRKKMKDQFGAKSVEDDPSREWMITRLVGPRIEIDEDTEEQVKASSYAGIPDDVLEMMSPAQLVGICKKMLRIEANIKEGKVGLLKKIRTHG